MYTVGILGHSLLKPYLPEGEFFQENHNNIYLNFHCQSGATYSSIFGTEAYSDLLNSSPDLVLLVLGGNDLVTGTRVSDVYSDLEYLVNSIVEGCSPQFGVYLVEPEQRYGDPRFVNPEDYNALRNSLVRKIRNKKFPSLLSITGRGITKEVLSEDGVHFDQFGQSLFITVIKGHISDLLFNSELAPSDL